MPPRSKKGKYRSTGLVSKVKVDILPPQGDPELSISGFAALFIGIIVAAVILSQAAAAAVATLALPLAIAASIVALIALIRKAGVI